MPFCCIMQPQTATIISGLVFLSSLSQVTFPSARRCALSRTQQVLKITKSAVSRLSASVMPISCSIPASFSLSCAFIWHPYVTTQ